MKPIVPFRLEPFYVEMSKFDLFDKYNGRYKNLIDVARYVKRKYKGTHFYKKGEVVCSLSDQRSTVICKQDQIMPRYSCGHVKEVHGPRCPVCDERNVVRVMPWEEGKQFLRLYEANRILKRNFESDMNAL
jgi:hypothetical protein